jgi:V8-like Glu-specific endopeptidase
MIRIVFALAWAALPAFAQEGAKVYKQAVPSVVWIHSARDRGLATGSGTLVDKERRLVLTNYHVVQDTRDAKVFFPVFRDGQPVAEKDYYTDRARRLSIHGTVIALDKKADLALIRLDSLPDKVESVPLAAASPEPGSTTHTIGNAGKSGALFGYVKGTVRQVYQKEWKAELEPRKVATFQAKVVETDSPTNPGDSGGPLLNDKGELVGVTQGGAIGASLVSTFIDVSEVKKLLDSQGVKEAKATKPEAKVVREAPLKIRDGAKLFSADGVAEADKAIAEIFKSDLDVLIETYPAAPSDRAGELKKATPAVRTEYFRDWLHARMLKEDVKGFGILICNDPKSLYVDVSPGLAKKFPEKFELKVRDAVIAGMKAGKPDDALKEALKLIGEQAGKGKP